MEYREVLELGRAEIEVKLRSPRLNDRLDALLSAAYYDPDWRWVQGLCLDILGDPQREERALAATCLGHLARIHRKLDVAVVLARLEPLKDDPLLGSYVRDALDDIAFYLRFQ